MNDRWMSYFGERAIPEPNSGCWLWELYVDGIGYGRHGRTEDEVKAHRLSWRLARGPIPVGAFVLHRCDVRCCVNPEHLFLGSQAENVADMIAKGRAVKRGPRGEDNAQARLDEEDVWAIRWMAKLKVSTQAQIARDYGVSPMTISRIVNGETWIHVPW
jgi:HNH endonuclease